MQVNRLIFLFFLTGFSQSLISQNIDPNFKVSLCEGFITGKKALEIIEKKYQIKFAYSPTTVNLNNEIYLCKRNIPLVELISQIVGFSVNLISENNHLIIKPSKTITTVLFTASGFIRNAYDFNPIDSVCIKVLDYTTHSNSLGYFNLNLITPKDSILIVISKNGYKTLHTKINYDLKKANFKLEPISTFKIKSLPGSVYIPTTQLENYWVPRVVVDQNQLLKTYSEKNLNSKPFQLSLLPKFGFFLSKSGQYTFNSSLNLLSGYVGGIKGVEIGVGINIVRNNLSGFQAAGLANIVGGEVRGLQISGLHNMSIGKLSGGQIALFSNSSMSFLIGFQFSLGANLSKSGLNGAQVASVNFSSDSINGMQLGLLNLSSQNDGGQIAVCNISQTNNFLQFAPLNVSETNRAIQFGAVNLSKKQKGFQLGLFNYADTSSGLSVGLINIIRKGYFCLDYTFTSGNFGDIKFKTGTERFYNIFCSSARLDKSLDISVGYGIGTKHIISKWLNINYDLTFSQVFENSNLNSYLNLLTRFDVQLLMPIYRRLSVVCGFQLNNLFTNITAQDSGNYFSTLPGKLTVYNDTFKNGRIYFWPELSFGVRF